MVDISISIRVSISYSAFPPRFAKLVVDISISITVSISYSAFQQCQQQGHHKNQYEHQLFSYSAFHPRFAKLVGAQITTLTLWRCTPVKNSGLEPQRVHFSDFSPLSLEKEKSQHISAGTAVALIWGFLQNPNFKEFYGKSLTGTNSMIKSILANAFFCGKSLIICMKTLIFQ